MIKYDNALINGAYTEGFEATFENGLLTFSKGAIYFLQEGREPEVFECKDGFSFDVIGDSEVNVVYNVFLTSKSLVLVQRVETFGDEPQVELEEGDELLHLLSTFTIPANATEFDINVRLIERMIQSEG